MSENYETIIVGGGIAGLALGCALAGSGRTTCVLEARSRTTRSKRGLTLQANGFEALEKLGLLLQVLNIGTKTKRVAWREIGGGTVATLDYTVLDHPNNYLLTVVPSDFERILREEFLAKGGTIYQSTAFQGVTVERPGSVSVRVLKEGTSVDLTARMLVGADGESSSVRKAARIPYTTKEYRDHYLFMLAGPVNALQLEARQYLGRGRMVGFYPAPGSTYIFCYVPEGKLASLKEQGLDSFKKELSGIDPDITDALGELPSWDDVGYAAPKRIDCETWVSVSIALIGDAAHALNPGFAQGANMGLQDAMLLAETVERCFEKDDFSLAALKPYDAARRKRVRFIQDQSERTAQITATESRFYSWLGKRLLKKTGGNRGLMKIALSASSGLSDHVSLRERIRFLF